MAVSQDVERRKEETLPGAWTFVIHVLISVSASVRFLQFYLQPSVCSFGHRLCLAIVKRFSVISFRWPFPSFSSPHCVPFRWTCAADWCFCCGSHKNMPQDITQEIQWSLLGRHAKYGFGHVPARSPYQSIRVCMWVARTTCVIILQFTTRFSVTRSKKSKSKTLLHFVFNWISAKQFSVLQFFQAPPICTFFFLHFLRPLSIAIEFIHLFISFRLFNSWTLASMSISLGLRPGACQISATLCIEQLLRSRVGWQNSGLGIYKNKITRIYTNIFLYTIHEKRLCFVCLLAVYNWAAPCPLGHSKFLSVHWLGGLARGVAFGGHLAGPFQLQRRFMAANSLWLFERFMA